MKSFADELRETLTDTLNELSSEAWKNGQKDLRELVADADAVVSALTEGVLGVTLQVSLENQIHYIVFYNHAENKTIGNIAAFQLSGDAAEKTEYPIIMPGSGVRFGNREALAGFIIGCFSGSRHPMIKTINDVLAAIKEAKK